ncbi:hypothetical protein [Amycolatopsis sp. NPDC051128]|uniref:hypothetical protein n=1 Tax=Amycolatopsis sp. NPDC051128 TaxID=3155412 RepID=UPI0034359A88
MARMKVNVTYSDGRVVQSSVSPKAEVEFERQFGTSINRAGADMHQQYYYYLAWAGLHFAGKEPADFDTFLGMIDEVENVQDPEAQLPEDPTKRVPQPEPSSS